MPRALFFGDRTPKVVDHLRQLSEWHQQNRVTFTLTTMAQRVRSVFPGVPAPPKPKLGWFVVQVDGKKIKKIKGPFDSEDLAKPVKKELAQKFRGLDVRQVRYTPADPLRHIMFKLAKKNKIWFGKP